MGRNDKQKLLEISVLEMVDFQDLGCEGMDWIDLAYGRGMWRALVDAVMNLRDP